MMDVYFFKLYVHILCLFMCFSLQRCAAITLKQQKKYDNRLWPPVKRADFIDPEEEWWRHLAELKRTNIDVSRSSSRKRREVADAFHENIIKTTEEKTNLESRSRKPERGETKISRSSLIHSAEKVPPRICENAGTEGGGGGTPAALGAIGIPGGTQGLPVGPPQTQARVSNGGGNPGSDSCCCNCRGGCSCSTEACAYGSSSGNKCPSSCNNAGSRCCGGNGGAGVPPSGSSGIAMRPNTIFLVVGEAAPMSVGHETPTPCGMPVGRAPIPVDTPEGRMAAGPVSGTVLPASPATSNVAASLFPIAFNVAVPSRGYEPPQALGMQEGLQNAGTGESASSRHKVLATPATSVPSGERGKDFVIAAT